MMKIFKTASLCALLIVFSLVVGCGKTMDKDVVQPVKSMYSQEDATVLKTAVTNVRQVRSALMTFAAGSANSEYPGDTQVYDYDSLREILPSASLPQDIADLKWDPAAGINYSSDGASFTLQVRALTKKNKLITATAAGVKW